MRYFYCEECENISGKILEEADDEYVCECVECGHEFIREKGRF